MKIAAVVILYNPDESIIDNIASYSNYVDFIYVFDNSRLVNKQVLEWCKTIHTVHYYHDGNNEGIAKRLNSAIDLGISEGYEWLLTMDQDSKFDKNNISKYLKCLSNQNDSELVAMYGVEYEEDIEILGECKIIECEHLITSGSVLNLSLCSVIGKFDENLFIDEVDLEYCYRAICKGFKIKKMQAVYMKHHLGTVSYFRSLKSLKLTPRTLHSPLRLYYMIRNYLYVDKLYPNQFKKSVAIRKGALINRVKNNLLYGKNKMKLIYFVFMAYFDYKNKRMGKR